MNHIDFKSLAAYALSTIQQWGPPGHTHGREYIMRNPRRDDKNAGSFRINLHTGRWADFATGDKGGDAVSLYAYINGTTQKQAYHELRLLLGSRRQ